MIVAMRSLSVTGMDLRSTESGQRNCPNCNLPNKFLYLYELHRCNGASRQRWTQPVACIMQKKWNEPTEIAWVQHSILWSFLLICSFLARASCFCFYCLPRTTTLKHSYQFCSLTRAEITDWIINISHQDAEELNFYRSSDINSYPF